MAETLIKPVLGPLTVVPWPFQQAAIDAVRAEYKKGVRKTLCVISTGLGKTLISAFIGRKVIEKGGKILFLAPSDELVEQAADKFDLLGIEVGIEHGKQKARATFEPDAVIGSIQTMRGRRLEDWPDDYFSMIVVDECDYGFLGTYRKILDHFANARVLGITATDTRASGEDLGEFYESVAYTRTAAEGMTDPDGPYLCRPVIVKCEIDIDLRGLRPHRNDFDEKDLEARIKPMVDVLANVVRQEYQGRRTLVFLPGVGSSQGMATALQSIGVNAEWVSGDDQEREAKIRRFREGATDVLASCSMIGRGFDVPEVSCVALFRPTKSESLLFQQMGRGLRIASGKENCLYLDVSCLTDGVDLARPVNLLVTPQTDQETLEIAQEILDREPKVDLLEAVEKAEVEHRERQVVRVQARERELKYKRTLRDPLSAYDAFGWTWKGPRVAQVSTRRCTEAMARALAKFGIEGGEKMSMTRARTTLDLCGQRARAGLSSLGQVQYLAGKFNVPIEEARAMTFREASLVIDMLKKEAG